MKSWVLTLWKWLSNQWENQEHARDMNKNFGKLKTANKHMVKESFASSNKMNENFSNEPSFFTSII